MECRQYHFEMEKARRLLELVFEDGLSGSEAGRIVRFSEAKVSRLLNAENHPEIENQFPGFTKLLLEARKRAGIKRPRRGRPVGGGRKK